jgi:hypothetical protein
MAAAAGDGHKFETFPAVHASGVKRPALALWYARSRRTFVGEETAAAAYSAQVAINASRTATVDFNHKLQSDRLSSELSSVCRELQEQAELVTSEFPLSDQSALPC